MITFKAVPTYEIAVSTMVLAEAAITTMPTMTGGMRRPRASTHGHDDEDQHGIPDQRSRYRRGSRPVFCRPLGRP